MHCGAGLAEGVQLSFGRAEGSQSRRNLYLMADVALTLNSQRVPTMAKAPPVPAASKSTKGPANDDEVARGQTDTEGDRKHHNAGEQGQTANIKQNTTNAGFFKGRRVK